ncbi:TetR/AcrR family transcriptional regulator [Angustibacter sp. McL0619]|uniref:TetR/AcrR family transcriptional regulator n=1 Tax=Angustibacter sp. McL0619 TaxID=3415676 RepID=UPI003CF9C5E8
MSQSRPYRSELREQQAERTRELIATSARERFLDKGWAGTSVRSVAEGAGVSEATVYSVYGSKAGLAISLIDAAEQRANVQQAIAELKEQAGSPLEQLRTFVDFDRRLFEQGGDVIRILGEGRRQHPELGVAYDEGRRRGTSQRTDVFSSWPATAWAPGMDAARAVAVYAALVSLESFDTATREYGWSPGEVGDWWASTLAQQFLK